MGLGREHVQEVLDPSRPEADVALRMDAAVDGFGRGGCGRDGCGEGGMGEAACTCCASGSGVAQEDV